MSNDDQHEKWRRDFLKTLYELVEGETLKFVEVQKVIERAGPRLAVAVRLPAAEGNITLPGDFIDGIARTLKHDGLIDIKENEQRRIVEVALTGKGVKETKALGLDSI